jgi:hypothetical protein
MQRVIPTNQPSNDQRKSFSARKTICASSGVAEQTHPMIPMSSNMMWGQLSDMISFIFAVKLRIYDSQIENRACRDANHGGIVCVRFQQETPLQYLPKVGRPHRMDLTTGGA